jgi:hypothetical protein
MVLMLIESPRTYRLRPEHELLLRAAVLHGEPALEAWRQWAERIDINALDGASLRLVPQLFRNLQQHDVRAPSMETLKAIYRHAWSRSQLKLRTVADAVRTLRDGGVDTLLLKGVALAVLHYRDLGARPMADVDVLIPWHQAPAAIRILVRAGWSPAFTGSVAKHMRYRHALPLREPGRGDLDLHWNILFECCGPDQDEACWQAAVPVEVAGVETKALCPADQLLHVIVHGSTWGSSPPIRWVADACVVLRSAGDRLDWSRVVREAERRHLVVAIERALAYLAARFDAAVPREVLERLRAVRPRRFERLEHQAKAQPRAAKLLGDLPLALFQFLRLTDDASPGRRCVVLGDYLAYRWHIESPSHVPLRVIEKAARRIISVPLGRLAAAVRDSRGERVSRVG